LFVATSQAEKGKSSPNMSFSQQSSVGSAGFADGEGSSAVFRRAQP